ETWIGGPSFTSIPVFRRALLALDCRTCEKARMIVLEDISLRIAGKLLHDHASVSIPDGARVGIVGRNGTGKTTLFRALDGDMDIETGAIRMPSRARLGRVAQEAPAGPETLVEVVLAADTERASLLKERETAK